MSRTICLGINLLLFTSMATLSTARTFTVTNNCNFTIWPAVYTDLNVGNSTPSVPTGWVAAPGNSQTFTVPDNWKSGRIWGRRNCDFSTNPGPNSCLDGGCNGGLLCDPRTGTGAPPATLAEFTLSSPDGNDYYDVSLVDGYNLPVSITNDKGCPLSDCPLDLGPNCPASLKGPLDPTGFSVGCKSDCLVDPNPANSPSCCSGTHNTPATCPPSGVPNYNYFKSNCPNSYVYAYDESSGTALFTCQVSKAANYVITFCPSSNGTVQTPTGTQSSPAQQTNQGTGQHGAQATSSNGFVSISHGMTRYYWGIFLMIVLFAT